MSLYSFYQNISLLQRSFIYLFRKNTIRFLVLYLFFCLYFFNFCFLVFCHLLPPFSLKFTKKKDDSVTIVFCHHFGKPCLRAGRSYSRIDNCGMPSGRDYLMSGKDSVVDRTMCSGGLPGFGTGCRNFRIIYRRMSVGVNSFCSCSTASCTSILRFSLSK